MSHRQLSDAVQGCGVNKCRHQDCYSKGKRKKTLELHSETLCLKKTKKRLKLKLLTQGRGAGGWERTEAGRGLDSPVRQLSLTMHSPATRAASQGIGPPSGGSTRQSPGTSSLESTHSSPEGGRIQCGLLPGHLPGPLPASAPHLAQAGAHTLAWTA